MNQIALHIIAHNEVEAIKERVTKYAKYFDEICIAIDDLPTMDALAELVLSEPKLKLFKFEWIDDFSAKRNFLASKITCPFYLRLDTDDEIENPEIIPELVKNMVIHNWDVFYVPYIYAKDENGNCVAKHWRETIIRKRPDIYWKKTVHENVFMEDMTTTQIVRDDRLKIIHNITHEDAVQSYERNMKYLVAEFKRDGVNSDPRTIAYLGRMCMAQGKWQETILFLENLVKRSGWDDDKYFAWIQMAQCYQQLGNLRVAIGCVNEALALNTTYPDAYLQMGALYLTKQDFVKAVDWLMPGIVRPEPDTVLVVDPTFYGYKASINAALALLGKGDIPMAIKYYTKAEQQSPNDAYVKSFKSLFVTAYETDTYVKNMAWLVRYTQNVDKTLIPHLIDAIPYQIMHDERACAMRNEFATPKKWDEKSIVLFCGQAWEDWCPASVLKGIGGSEEAVIYLSKELIALGYNVTVFNSCGDMAGEYDGVVYKPYFQFNPNDNYNILISWRMNFFDNVKAKQKIVWLHDVPQEGMFTPQSVKNIDKIVVLSNYHKSLMPTFIPEDKLFVSSNGVNLVDFLENGVLRNPKRLIYTSSYDRGIEHLLKVWQDVLTDVPDAELHIFYGWNTYDAMMAKGARDPKFKAYMVNLMNQPNVTEHGRIGHKALVREFMKSGVWVYPSHFEEISCISAMKAQAAGCVPVCTDYAALAETVKEGIKVEGSCINPDVVNRLKQELIKILKSPDEQEILREKVLTHKSEFGWSIVAKQWKEGLFLAKNPD